jgi:hypothetical protein
MDYQLNTILTSAIPMRQLSEHLVVVVAAILKTATEGSRCIKAGQPHRTADVPDGVLQIKPAGVVSSSSAFRRYDDPSFNGIRRMWNGGPLRQFSVTQANGHYIAYCSPFLTGYAGSYVCDRCLRPSAAVYRLRTSRQWLCATCKKERKQTGDQP